MTVTDDIPSAMMDDDDDGNVIIAASYGEGPAHVGEGVRGLVLDQGLHHGLHKLHDLRQRPGGSGVAAMMMVTIKILYCVHVCTL